MSIQSESNYQPPVFIWFNPKHLLVKNASFCWLIPISANKPLSFQNFGICFAFISVVNYTTFWAGSAGTFFDGARLATRRSRWGAGRAWRAKRWDIAMWVSCSCQWHVYWWCQWWISHDISWYLMISHIRNLVHVGMGWNILIIAKNDKQNVSFSGDEHPCSIYVGLNRRAQGVFTHSHVVCIHWGYYIVCINDIMTYFTSSLWFWVWKQRMPPSIAMW